jgi:hypothetical protein
VHKKWAANWENVVLPRIHSPYYYYVLISQRIPSTSRLAPDWGNQPGEDTDTRSRASSKHHRQEASREAPG